MNSLQYVAIADGHVSRRVFNFADKAAEHCVLIAYRRHRKYPTEVTILAVVRESGRHLVSIEYGPYRVRRILKGRHKARYSESMDLV